MTANALELNKPTDPCGFPGCSGDRVCLQYRRLSFDPLVGNIPWRRACLPTPVLPKELSGQRSLAGYSPWSRKGSDTTERLTLSLSLDLKGFPGGSAVKNPLAMQGSQERDPLQYSCLKNPMDRGAWQATIHGVARVRHDLATKPPPPL